MSDFFDNNNDNTLQALQRDSGETIPDTIREIEDELSEAVLFELIDQQLSASVWQGSQINYVDLYEKKYDSLVSAIDITDYAENKQELTDKICSVMTYVEDRLNTLFGVKVGTDMEYDDLTKRFRLLSNMYEFLVVRQKENVSNFIYTYMIQHKAEFIKTLSAREGDPAKDLFYAMSKKQSEDPSMAYLVHFMDEIIADIRDLDGSADEYISITTECDPDEVVNDAIKDAFTVNYGNAGCFDNAQTTYSKIMSCLNNKDNCEECSRAITEKLLTSNNIF